MNNTYLSEANQESYRKIYKENLHSLEKSTFMVCAMLTPNNPDYFLFADRLARSCEMFEVPYCIYEVANVHKSISLNGIDDPSCTKAKFVLFNMARFSKKNILYVDVDMFFVEYPEKIVRVSNEGYDFAIYNWLSDEHNEAYTPINGKIEAGNRHSDFYVFSHGIDLYSADQLICSGGVQYYGNSPAAMKLLEHWQDFVTHNPDFADDEGLDYVYNNFILHSVKLRAYWFDKSYLRLPWWPHVRPVIIHPGLPFGGRDAHISEIDGRKRVYPERCQRKTSDLLFPRDFIIDTKKHVLLRVVNNRIVDHRLIRQDFWIYPESVGLG